MLHNIQLNKTNYLVVINSVVKFERFKGLNLKHLSERHQDNDGDHYVIVIKFPYRIFNIQCEP